MADISSMQIGDSFADLPEEAKQNGQREMLNAVQKSAPGGIFEHERVSALFGLTISFVTAGGEVLLILEHSHYIAMVELFQKGVFVAQMQGQLCVVGGNCLDSHLVSALAIAEYGGVSSSAYNLQRIFAHLPKYYSMDLEAFKYNPDRIRCPIVSLLRDPKYLSQLNLIKRLKFNIGFEIVIFSLLKFILFTE